MAIKVVNSRYPGFIYDGENSRDYGVYITDVEVFGAPKRKVQMISIPGRNGDYALDEGSFENIPVKYKCVLGAGTEEDFNNGISDFRNWLASKVGYKVLSDEINLGEYRKAVFLDGMEVPTLNKKTGTFDVLFDCKPQRFLKSGEIPRTIGGAVTNTQTKSGTVISIDSDGGDKATSLIATIEAVQDGSGDPSPDNARAITGWTEAKVFDTGKNLVDESTAIGYNAAVSVGGGYISVTKNTASNYPAAHIDVYLRSGVTYTVSATCVQATAQAKLAIRDIAPSNTTVASMTGYFTDGQRKSITYTPTKSGIYRVALFSCFGTADTGTAIFTDIQCDVGSTATPYEPFTGTTTTTALGQTVYGGTADVVAGTLTLTHKAETFDGTESWGKDSGNNYYVNLNATNKMVGRKSGGLNSELLANWLKPAPSGADNTVYVGTSGTYLNAKCSSASDVAAFKSMLSATPLVVVYPLETPQTYTLTAQEVSLLTGNNNVWADTGDISITYGHDPNVLVNPTLFESNPLIELVGYGGVDFNGTPITVYNYTLGDIELTAAETHGFVDEQFRITNTATYTFETAFLNPGDPVYMQGGEFLFKFYTTSKVWVQSWSSDGFIGTPTDGTYITPSVPKNLTNAGNWTSNTFYIHANITNTVSFVYGTATTINDTAALSVEYRDRDSITHTSNFDISFTATYNGGGTVAVSITTTSVGSQCEENSYPYDNMHFAAFSTFSATSSYAPSDLFIDSDIGEAYFLQSGAAISANDYIYMNELPTLKPGANMITYDNTITDFQVVPRWWKV